VQEHLDKLIRKVYRGWKAQNPSPADTHPDEETLACFLEARLERKASEEVKLHILSCEPCAEALALQLRLETTERLPVPEELISRVKDLVKESPQSCLLEIILKLKEKAIELINTSGDVLVGLELVPAPVLRSRQIHDFKDEVNILKDFKDFRVEVKIENKGGNIFNLIIQAKKRETQEVIKDLRVTLLKEDLELESYLTETGAVTFEHIQLGKYTVEISDLEKKLASVLLDIRV